MKLTLEEAKRMMDENDGNLNLMDTNISELPQGLCVGGYLDLTGTNISELPQGLCVGGSLYLRGTNISELPQGLCVGGSLYLRDTKISGKEKELKKVHRLKDGDYVKGKYLYADGILTHVKSKRTLSNGYEFYHGKIKGKNVISDGTHYAHCKTVKDGVADLLFKTAKDRGKKQYENIRIDDPIKAEDAIAMYRVITGACRQGTESFLSTIGDLKETYTPREIIEITKGQFGAETFKKFFEER